MKVLLGVPHNGTVSWAAAQSAWRCSADHKVEVSNLPTSLLALGFNCLYTQALNRNEAGDGITHFAMLHSDIAVDGYWLDTLLRIMSERDADMVSAVNSIKDDRNLTSTAIALPGESWRPWRRFTMTEVLDMPATFNAAEACYEGAVLLHNSGCWVADLRKPLFHEADEDGELRAFFTIRDRVRRRDGQWVPEVESEDWFFSRRLHELGADTYVTREVVTHHFGLAELDNQTDRGTFSQDLATPMDWAKVLKEELSATA